MRDELFYKKRHVLDYIARHRTNYYFDEIIGSSDDFVAGFELEVSLNKYCSEVPAKKILYISKHSLPSFCFAKHDCTIGAGIEIVSLPIGYNEIMKNKEIETMCRKLQHYKMRNIQSESTKTGLHIHVGNKEFKDDAHRFNIIEFIKRNAIYIYKLSKRRYVHGYGGLSAYTDLNMIRNTDLSSIGRNGNINPMTRRYGTFEYRMFCGIPKISYIRACYDFVKICTEINRDRVRSWIDFLYEARQYNYIWRLL